MLQRASMRLLRKTTSHLMTIIHVSQREGVHFSFFFLRQTIPLIDIAVTPREYACAVKSYSRLPTGSGQDYAWLGKFLSSDHPYMINVDRNSQARQQTYATVYKIPLFYANDDQKKKYLSRSYHSERPRREGPRHFSSPEKFKSFQEENIDYLSTQIIVIRGYQTATWINTIGAFTSKGGIDPEFFCRHMHDLVSDADSNNFSLPGLPSSSSYLLQLPVITIRARYSDGTNRTQASVDALRVDGKKGLDKHHDNIAVFTRGKMQLGDSMVRQFYVFDRTHVAFEQKISICLQEICGSFRRKFHFERLCLWRN